MADDIDFLPESNSTGVRERYAPSRYDSKSDVSTDLSRRRVLLGLGASASAIGGFSVGGIADDGSSEYHISIDDQNSDGETLVLDSISGPEDGQFFVQDRAPKGESNTLFVVEDVPDGTTEEDVTVELETRIDESMVVEAWLIDGDFVEDDWDLLDIDDAFVSVDDEIDAEFFGTSFVEADPEFGFNYPYYLYVPLPDEGVDEADVPILVEPNNTGETTDDFERHRERAEGLVGAGVSRDVSDELNVPLLVPVFPRSEQDPVDWTHYTHALDDTTLGIEDGPLERIDLQLLRMVEHAQERLRDHDYSVRSGEDDVILNGFSASGNFVDRFAFLHPDRVRSVTAGGLNGMPLLPVEEVDGEPLPYHVGIADVEDLTGEPVDLDALDDVNQFLYMGAEDSNDTIPYDDAWTDDDLRQRALDVYGEDMINERFVRSQELYREAGVDAQFRVYEDAGHTPRPAVDDVVEFHRKSIAGEDVSGFGQNLVPEIAFTATPSAPTTRDDVVFDASDSDPAQREIVAYTWNFDDETTAAGETTTHRFEDDGEYAVQLRVVFGDGGEETITKSLTVAAEEDGDSDAGPSGASDDEDTPGEDDSDADSTDEEGDDSAVEESRTEREEVDAESTEGDRADTVPGFGILGGLTTVGGAGYFLKRRHDAHERSSFDRDR